MAFIFAMKLMMPLTAFIILLALAVRSQFLISTVIAGVTLSILDGLLGWHRDEVPFLWLLQSYTIGAFLLLAPVFCVRTLRCLSRGTSDEKKWLRWKLNRALIVISSLMLIGGWIYGLVVSFQFFWTTGSIFVGAWQYLIVLIFVALGALGLLASYHYCKWELRNNSRIKEVLPALSQLP